MGIFNNAKNRGDDQSASKVNFGVFLTNNATKEQFKNIKREMKSYRHRKKELDNKMNRALDMGGNEIINFRNPDKPHDAVLRRFIFKKIESVIEDCDLEGIKTIKELL